MKYKEFSYSDLFELLTISDKRSKADITSDGKIPLLSADTTNNGVIGFIDRTPEFIIDEECPYYLVFGDHTRTMNIITESFCVADNVKVLKPKFFNRNVTQYIATTWQKAIPNLGYARHWSKAKVVKIMLPTLDGKTPNYKYMDEYISSLRTERIDVLKEYLKLRGINEDELSESELLFLGTDKDILAALNKKLSEASWGEYLIGSLFEKVETKKLAYKAKDLPDKPQGNYKLPCLTSSFRNQGLNYYVPLDDATIIKNVISIPSNSDVYRAYYQPNDFTVLSDAYAIEWLSDENLTPEQYLFFVACINKVTDLPIYSYKNKLGGWNTVKNKKILLPQKNGCIDMEFINNYIRILMKYLVKDIVGFTS